MLISEISRNNRQQQAGFGASYIQVEKLFTIPPGRKKKLRSSNTNVIKLLSGAFPKLEKYITRKKNTKGKFGKWISNILPKPQNKPPDVALIKYRLDKVVEKEMAKGNYTDAYNTLENALAIANKYSNNGHKTKALSVTCMVENIIEKRIMPITNRINAKQNLFRKNVGEEANALLKLLSNISAE